MEFDRRNEESIIIVNNGKTIKNKNPKKEATMNDLMLVINNLSVKMDKGFDKVDDRFEKVDERFEKNRSSIQ